MAILVDKRTKVLIYGMTGHYASLQSKAMLDYGTKIVAGIATGRGGDALSGIPLYDSVKEAIKEHEITTAILYVPAPYVLEAFYEILEHGIKVIFIATEGLPVHDSMKIHYCSRLEDAWVIGPNSLGIITPQETLLGSMAATYAMPGTIGLISRSGTLSSLMLRVLYENGYGVSTAVSIGGDRVIGRTAAEYLSLFEKDPLTSRIVLLGEIGGTMEFQAAETIKHISKPVICYIVGKCSPWGKTMGHSGAIINEKKDLAEEKIKVLHDCGAEIAETPWDIPLILDRLVKQNQC